MCLSIISTSNIEKEKEILANINKSIDNNESIIFSSGAGSGKTFALIESLKYIQNKYGNKLKSHNQKIMCITYTNVATDEVKDRLGNSDIVKVSTIHERIWDLIKNYQEELLKIHKEKLKEEIDKFTFGLNEDTEKESKFKVYREFSIESKGNFRTIVLENKDTFYKKYDKNAKEFRDAFSDIMNNFPDILKNVGNFKNIVSIIYRIENYNTCLKNIISLKNGYKKVHYDSTFNRDRLHRMFISHDTLLEYGLKIINKYYILQKIIIDKYPYILIDEYQDTNDKIVKIMKLLFDQAKKIEHNIFIGYFGDSAQNIYEDGVGKNIINIHPELKKINKEFNRRSTKEVITVINKIRKDEIEQVSIYDDCNCGSVKFYKGNIEDQSRFIEKYISEWNIDNENKLHCLILTNKLVAKFSNFENIYTFLTKTDYYKKNYDQVNTELLSNDLSKLGEIPNLIFKIIKLKNDLTNVKSLLTEFLYQDLYTDLTINNLRELVNILLSIKGDNLHKFVRSIIDIYIKTENLKYKIFMDKLFGFNNISFEKFFSYFLSNLYPNLEDEKIDEANSNINNLLQVSINEFDLWYKFILTEQNRKIIYHTYHGTKGLEFKNVIIIMANDFGISRNMFNSFFENFNSSNTLTGKEKLKFENTQNLLYVSCSRAINNLRVFYLDDISKFEVGIKTIFGQICTFDSANTQLHSQAR